MGLLKTKFASLILGVFIGIAATVVVLLVCPSQTDDAKWSIDDLFQENVADQKPLSNLLSLPGKQLSATEIRERLPGWLGLPQLPPLQISSIERRDPVPIERQLAKKTELLLDTNYGRFQAHLVETAQGPDRNWICIFQTGMEGQEHFWEYFKDTICRISNLGITVFLPPQIIYTDCELTKFSERVTYRTRIGAAYLYNALKPGYSPSHSLESECEETRVSFRLYQLGSSLGGAQVRLTQGLLDWLQEQYPNKNILYVGHSAGSASGYLLAALDPRISAIALDSFPELDYPVFHIWDFYPFPGVYQLKDWHTDNIDGSKSFRTDFLQAKTVHQQTYGFPDRQALLSWINEASRPALEH